MLTKYCKLKNLEYHLRVFSAASIFHNSFLFYINLVRQVIQQQDTFKCIVLLKMFGNKSCGSIQVFTGMVL